jgi:hypothetical protein
MFPYNNAPSVQEFPGTTGAFLKTLQEMTSRMDLSRTLRTQLDNPTTPHDILVALHRVDAVKEFVDDLVHEYEQQQADIRSLSSENPGGRFGESADGMELSVRVVSGDS